MPWIQLRVPASQQTAEHYSDLLMEAGAAAVTMLDAEDKPVFEPAPGETKLWQSVILMGLFEADTDMDGVLAQLGNTEMGTAFEYKIEQVEDKDWEREWMDNFHPMCFGERLWVCPSWKPAPDPNAVNILLDPGLAFGTGTHPTTDLCLQWLDANAALLQDAIVVDYGCGSGILAIAALKLGAKHVFAVDIDPQALQATRENAARNGIAEDALTVQYPETFQPVQADIVLSNILSGPLQQLAPALAQCVKPQGHLVLSGLLEIQAADLIEIYQKWFNMEPVVVKQEWGRLSGIKAR